GRHGGAGRGAARCAGGRHRGAGRGAARGAGGRHGRAGRGAARGAGRRPTRRGGGAGAARGRRDGYRGARGRRGAGRGGRRRRFRRRRAAGGDAAPLLARIAAAREVPDAGAAAPRRPAESRLVLDAARRVPAAVGPAAGHRPRRAAGRTLRAPDDEVTALRPQRSVLHRLLGDGRDATHVVIVARRARAVAGLIGGGASGRDGLLVAGHRAAGRARGGAVVWRGLSVGFHTEGGAGEEEQRKQ